MDARPYQIELNQRVDEARAAGLRNVLMRLDTGGGKTVVLAKRHREHRGASVVMAHRHELVTQLSKAIAREGVPHRIIGSDATIRACVAEQIADTGKSFYSATAACAVASVDTLVRAPGLESWAAQVTFGTCDEAHHCVEDNKWHRATELFKHPACWWLGPTATPQRADGKGLGRGQGGIFDAMVQGPEMRWLIDQGYLCDYDIACPTSDLAVLEDAGASGDWSSKQLREAAQRSHIVGDVVKNYQKFARGRLGVTFATDIETASEITAAYQAAGTPAATLTGKTDGGVRRQMLRQLAAREILMIVAVDIISEGFDLPAIEVAIFARPTQSLALYMQQFGRALRVLPTDGYAIANTQAERLAAIAASVKPRALIIDMVANTLRHRVPDLVRPWSLMARGRGDGGGGIPMTICANDLCVRPFERSHSEGPYCGTPAPAPEPGARGSPAAVDGDLVLLGADLLAALRGQVADALVTVDEYRAEMVAKGSPYVQANVRRHHEKLEAQALLWEAIGAFGGSRLARGRADRQIQREFYLTFGCDVLSARLLGTVEALALRDKIRAAL